MKNGCDCESVECGHEPGDCQRNGYVRVELYGHITNLCAICAGIAKAFAEDKYKELGPARCRVAAEQAKINQGKA